jgi:hypothetical protein
LTEHGQNDHEHHVRGNQVVLDIGGDTGALLIYTTASRGGEEIEIYQAGGTGRRTHSQVHPRFVGETTVYAAVYPELEAGEYVCCSEAADRAPFTIKGGAVTQLDWRAPKALCRSSPVAPN